MAEAAQLALFVVVVVLLFSALLLMSYLFRRVADRESETSRETVPGTSPCVPAESLVDVSEEECCIQGGIRTNFRYSPELDAVVGPSAVNYLQACRSFCEGGAVNVALRRCAEGDSAQYQACIDRISPDLCSTVARPIARVGATPYYVVDVTSSSCMLRYTC